MKRLFLSFFALLATASFAASDINSGWMFQKGEADDALAKRVDASEWQSVEIPHTYTPSGSSEVYRNQKEDVMYAGPGWYRKNVAISKADAGKRIFLRFGAAYLSTDVYVNGKKVGTHKGGYSAFIFEITDFVKFGVDNLVSVRVDNSHTDEITPLGGGYIKFGGITRSMDLIVKNNFCISPVHFASSGVYCTQLDVTDKKADLAITTMVNSTKKDSGNFKVVATIKDDNNKVVAKETTTGAIKSGEQWGVKTPIVVNNPELWEGKKNPALYTVTVDLYKNNTKVDSKTVTTGFRSVSVDRDKGFFLNGKSYPLRGVAQHEYYPVSGSAMDKKEYDTDMDIINDIGANAVRFSHYPHAEYRYELCDKSGVVAFAEMAFIKEFFMTEAFIGSCTQQVQEMVYQLYNHPSIAMWGLYNEIRYDSFKGVDGLPLVRELNTLAKEADPSRLTVGVSWLEGKRSDIPDLSAWNRYQAWYWNAYPGSNDNFSWIDQMRELHPNRKLGLGEYGSGGIFNHFDENRKNAPYNSDQFHPVDFFDYSHEEQFKAIEKRPWLWGTFVWTLCEFICPGYDQGAKTFLHTKGLVSENRTDKKDVYYFYKANWRKDVPVFNLSYKRFDVRFNDLAEVTVYSNFDNATLTVNGVDMGTLKNADHCIYRWENIKLKDGDNTIVATGIKDGKTYTESAVWHRVADIHNSCRIKEIVPIESEWKVLMKDEIAQTAKSAGTGVPGEEINSKFDMTSTVWQNSSSWDSMKLPLYTDTRPMPGNWSGKMVYLTKEFEVTEDIENPCLYLLHTAKLSKQNGGRVSIAIDGIGVMTLEEGYEDAYRLMPIEARLGKLSKGKHTISVIANTPTTGKIDVGLVDVK